MSNQQWNNGQGGEWGAQQQNQEWGQPAQQDWGQPQPQPSAQDWTQAQSQPSAQDWTQQGAPQQGWGQQQEWGQQQGAPQQDWGQQQGAPQQDWNQSAPVWQGQPAPGYFPGQAPAPARRDPSPFDFSWAKLSLPTSAKLIFMLGVVALGVEWLFNLIYALALGSGPATLVIQGIFVGLAGVLVKVLVLRVLIEIGVAATKLLALRESEESARSAEATEPEAPTAS